MKRVVYDSDDDDIFTAMVKLNNLRHEAVRFEGSLAFIGFTL